MTTDKRCNFEKEIISLHCHSEDLQLISLIAIAFELFSDCKITESLSNKIVRVFWKNVTNSQRKLAVKPYGKNWSTLFFIRHEPHRKQRVQQFFHFYMYIFVASALFLPSRCLATIGGYFVDTQTDGSYLWSRPLRCAQVPWCTYQVS
jgi:hypothetical protein